MNLYYLCLHGTYTFMNVKICMDVAQTRLYSFTTTLHFIATPASLSSAQASEQPPSCHQSFQLTDHPGVACHVQTATATCLPHAHCCHAGHPLLQNHSCPHWPHREARPLVLVVLVKNGRVELPARNKVIRQQELHTGRVLGRSRTTWSPQHAPSAS
jgi:hypothetical protein